VQFGGLDLLQRRSPGRKQKSLDHFATTLHPELNPSKSEKSFSAFLIDPFPENTKLATLFPMRETRTAVVSDSRVSCNYRSGLAPERRKSVAWLFHSETPGFPHAKVPFPDRP
jgi:hypothetical protein